jgi:hypothetical protein
MKREPKFAWGLYAEAVLTGLTLEPWQRIGCGLYGKGGQMYYATHEKHPLCVLAGW